MLSDDRPILVTNDDGVDAPGLVSLAAELYRRFGARVIVVAPLAERSAVGHGITLRDELIVRRVELPGLPSVRAYGVSGTPVDCVKIGVRVLLDRPPGLVCAGVNHGYNLGTDVFYSGTVSAALEAVILGYPSLAGSTGRGSANVRDAAASIIGELADRVMRRGLPDHTLLNVNVPPGAGHAADPAAWEVTRLGLRSYQNVFARVDQSAAGDHYVLASETMIDEHANGTDIAAVSNGRISVTPIHLDLTNHSVLTAMTEWIR